MDTQEQVWRTYWPVLVTILISGLLVLLHLSRLEWDATGLIRIGTRYSQLNPNGTEGYDGQFAYYMARNLDPEQVAPHLDVPAYRYQRIIYPLLARLLSLGKQAWLPWTLLLLNLAAHAAGTFAVCQLLRDEGQPAHYALIYGLWVGLVTGIVADLYEPLAFTWIAFAWVMRRRERPWMSYMLLTLALMSKETTLPFWLAAVSADVIKDRSARAMAPALTSALVYGAWQGWLWVSFGESGFASGGANASGFEWLPFAGFLRISTINMWVMVIYALLFGPTIVLPTILALIAGVRRLVQGEMTMRIFALLYNALIIVVLPFSTFSEPFGLLRTATGLVFSVLLYAAHYNASRSLNYGMFWMAFLAFVLH